MTETLANRISRLESLEYIRIGGVRVAKYAMSQPFKDMLASLSNGEVYYCAKFARVAKGSGQEYSVLVSIDLTEKHGYLQHASISLRDRLPTFLELKDLRYAVWSPDVDVMQVFPSDENYVNIDKHCLHLWEMPEKWEIQ